MKRQRIMRFIGNRPEPEKDRYNPSEALIETQKIVEDRLRQTMQQTRLAAMLAKRTKRRRPKPPKPAPEPELFETNLIEPLVGWKVWHIRDGRLWSQLFGGNMWSPMQPLHAQCRGATRCGLPLSTACTCGVYAANDFNQVIEFLNHGEACGKVLGWGRYIRAEAGWRAEYVYPAKLLIARDSLGHLDKLKEYYVPIYVMDPIRLYDPAEDGYEYWQDEASWSLGTPEVSHAQEDQAGSGASTGD